MTNLIMILLAGLVDALGGAWKDYYIEGFKWKVFPRSLIFAALICWIPFSSNPIITFLCAGYVVRALVEIKKFIATDFDYSKYWSKRYEEYEDRL